jgi:hypothetical protein
MLITPSPQIVEGRNIADQIKSRATLVGLIEPAGITLGLAMTPMQTWDSVSTIASAAFHGNMGDAGKEVGELVDRAMHPGGMAGVVYKSGLGLRAAVDGVVGGLELYQGFKNNDKYLKWMGAADMVTCASTASVAVGQPIVGLGLGLTAAAAKTYLVLKNPDEYSRIQKVKTLFDAAGAVSSGMLKAGFFIGPALAMNAVFGPTQMLYMNNEKFREKADKVIDWVLDKF